MNVSQAIKACPKSIFNTGRGDDRRPNYSGVFAFVASAILEANGVEHDRDTIVRVAEAINLSSLQRMIAAEAARRRDGDGEPLPPPKAAKKTPAVRALSAADMEETDEAPKAKKAPAPKKPNPGGPFGNKTRHAPAPRKAAKPAPKEARKKANAATVEDVKAAAKARAAKAAEDLI